VRKSIQNSSGAKGCCSRPSRLVDGYLDKPGFAQLPSFSPLLHVGNQYSPAFGDFNIVLSTVMPKGGDGKDKPELSSHGLFFEDEHGREVAAKARLARRLIVQGAALVRKSVRAGQRTLVHCEWGQNRSGSICCAYAVLYLGWSARAAIAYMRAQNRKQRQYKGQVPMSNRCFNRILAELEKTRRAMQARG